MQYTFDEIEIPTPGHPGGACGRLDPVTVEWNALAADWPQVLVTGISAIKVHSTQDSNVCITDVLASATLESDFVCAMVAKEIARREQDQAWMMMMWLHFKIEKQACRTEPKLRLVKL